MDTWTPTGLGDEDSEPEEAGFLASRNGHSQQSASEEQRLFEPPEPSPRSAVLLDQHPLWLDAIEPVLARDGIQVVGKATSPRMALDMLVETRPRFFVAEIGLQYAGMDGLTCLRQARKIIPSLRIIVLSVAEDPELIDAAFAAGALAYIVKKAHPDDVGAAIRQSLDPSIFFAEGHGSAPAVPRPVEAASGNRHEVSQTHGLTTREVEVLQMVAEGYSNGQLARMLWVTEQTVKFHLSSLYRKLDVSNRTGASRWAQLHKLLPETPAVDARV